MYVNITAVAIVVGFIVAFFVLLIVVARNDWVTTEQGRAQEARLRNEAIHHRREAKAQQERARAEAGRLENIRARAIREARAGFEQDVQGHRPLTLDELREQIESLPDAGSYRGNHMRTAVYQASIASPFRDPNPSLAIRHLSFTRLHLARQKPIYDRRAFPNGIPGIDAYPMPERGDAPLPRGAYQEESVWAYDGQVIVSPLTLDASISRYRPDEIGGQLRKLLAPRFGPAVESLSDRDIEQAIYAGLSMMNGRGMRR